MSSRSGTRENGTAQKKSQRGQSEGQKYGSSETDRGGDDADENTRMISQEESTQGNYMSMDSSSSDLRESSGKGRQNSVTKKRRPRRQSEQNETSSAGGRKGGTFTHWWKHLIKSFSNIELENTGSVARDHLSLERTYLAWLRTSLSFASIGIAVTQLFRLNTSLEKREHMSEQAKLRRVGKPLGAAFLGIAVVILFIGYYRYFESQHYVIRNKFPASRGAVIFITLMAGALIFTSLVVIIAIAPKALEA